jgi:hypothetical protein
VKAYVQIIIGLIVITNSLSVHSAEMCSQRDLGISLGLGIHYESGKTAHWYPAPNTNINTTIAYGFGLHYRSISLFYGTKLNISTEAYYFANDSDPVPLDYGEATTRYSGYFMPMLIWTELMPKSKFGPFVRIGIGAIWTDWSDECSDDKLFSPHHQYWSFAYGLGGGIYYSPSDKYDIIVIIQSTISTGESTVGDDYYGYHKLPGPRSHEYWGIALRYWL